MLTSNKSPIQRLTGVRKMLLILQWLIVLGGAYALGIRPNKTTEEERAERNAKKARLLKESTEAKEVVVPKSNKELLDIINKVNADIAKRSKRRGYWN